MVTAKVNTRDGWDGWSHSQSYMTVMATDNIPGLDICLSQLLTKLPLSLILTLSHRWSDWESVWTRRFCLW